MTISILFVLVFTILLLIWKMENKLTFAFGAGFLSVLMLMIALAIYTIRISNYRYFFMFEFYIIRRLGSINISYYDLKYLVLISVGIFMALMFYLYTEGIPGKSSYRQNSISMALFLVSVCLFMLFNSNYFEEYLYIKTHFCKNPVLKKFLSAVSGTRYIVFCLYIAVMCVVPHVRFFTEYRKTRLFYKKKFLISLMLAVMFLQGLFLFMLFMTPLRHCISVNGMYDILSASGMYVRNVDYYILIITVTLLVIMAFIFIKSYILSDVNLLTTHHKTKKAKFVMRDMRHIFHTFKNLMAMISVLDKKAIENFGTDECMDALSEIGETADMFADKIRKFLVLNNKPSFVFDEIQLSDCVKNAASKIRSIYGVSANICEKSSDTLVYSDFAELTEVFINLFTNAVEASGHGCVIDVDIWREDKLVCVSVTDNGKGIDKATMKKLFKPFISGKKTFTNWGIGLAYGKNVVEANLGFVFAKSEPGRTEFQVILPYGG